MGHNTNLSRKKEAETLKIGTGLSASVTHSARRAITLLAALHLGRPARARHPRAQNNRDGRRHGAPRQGARAARRRRAEGAPRATARLKTPAGQKWDDLFRRLGSLVHIPGLYLGHMALNIGHCGK